MEGDRIIIPTDLTDEENQVIEEYLSPYRAIIGAHKKIKELEHRIEILERANPYETLDE